ncbi:MAG: hypothetical protein Q8L88_00510 [Bacteroidota bacterium]|nr:hypothetical protein [Bacteroidota bacterium]
MKDNYGQHWENNNSNHHHYRKGKETMKLIKRNLDKALDVAEIIIKTIRTVAEEVKKLKPSTRKEK